MRQQVGPPQLVEGGDDLAVGQVAGSRRTGRARTGREPARAGGPRGATFSRRPGLEPRFLTLAGEAGGPSSSGVRLSRVAPGEPGSAGPRGLDGSRSLATGLSSPSHRALCRPDATVGYSVLTGWPPNSLRNAASTLAPYK